MSLTRHIYLEQVAIQNINEYNVFAVFIPKFINTADQPTLFSYVMYIKWIPNLFA